EPVDDFVEIHAAKGSGDHVDAELDDEVSGGGRGKFEQARPGGGETAFDDAIAVPCRETPAALEELAGVSAVGFEESDGAFAEGGPLFFKEFVPEQVGHDVSAEGAAGFLVGEGAEFGAARVAGEQVADAGPASLDGAEQGFGAVVGKRGGVIGTWGIHLR